MKMHCTIIKRFIFLLATVVTLNSYAQTDFITRWDFSKQGSAVGQISFGVGTTGVVSYTWQEISPGTGSGSGTFTGSTATIITGLSDSSVIRLSIDTANFNSIKIATAGDQSRLVDVEQWGVVAWSTMNSAFAACENLNISATDLPDLNNVHDMNSMFYSCFNLNGPSNIGSWNTGAVTVMYGMFSNASSFNQPIDNWNTAAVTNMSHMFYYAGSFNQPINNWNTAAVTIMNVMFAETHFNQPIGNWNTAAVTNIDEMFYYADAFNQPIGGWNTAAVTSMIGMFYHATSFNQPIDSWNTAAVTNMGDMFDHAVSFNQPIGSWNTAAVTEIDYMFYQATSFNQPIGSWNTAAVTDMNRMFYQATSFNQPIGSWNTAAVSDMSAMFNQASSFNQPIGNWNLSSSPYLNGMFNLSGMDCTNYTTTLLGWRNNVSTPNNRYLGAVGLHYGTDAVAARTYLITTKAWTITGDAPSGVACLTTGLNESEQEDLTLQLAPNPVHDVLSLSISNGNKISEIKIFDVLGKQVYFQRIQSIGISAEKINVSALPSGIYFVVTTLSETSADSDKITAQTKFVKE